LEVLVKYVLLAVPLLAVGVLAAGCASSSSSTTTTGSAPTVASSAGGADAGSTGSGTGGASTPAGGSGGTAASGTACTSADLKVSLGGGAGAGMSQNRIGLQFTNVGSAACTLDGYPGVSWVAGANGHQVGAAATRQADSSGGAQQTVTLAPGAIASAPLDIVDAAVFSKSACKPVPVRGLRVYPPNETNALFLSMPTASGGYGECSGTTPQSPLTIGYVQSGAQPSN
jgi:hypothetical protein